MGAMGARLGGSSNNSDPGDISDSAGGNGSASENVEGGVGLSHTLAGFGSPSATASTTQTSAESILKAAAEGAAGDVDSGSDEASGSQLKLSIAPPAEVSTSQTSATPPPSDSGGGSGATSSVNTSRSEAGRDGDHQGPDQQAKMAWLEAAAASAAKLSGPPPPPPLAPAPLRRPVTASAAWLEAGTAGGNEVTVSTRHHTAPSRQRGSGTILSTPAPGQEQRAGSEARGVTLCHGNYSTKPVMTSMKAVSGSTARRPSDAVSDGRYADSADFWEHAIATGTKMGSWPGAKEDPSDLEEDDEDDEEVNQRIAERQRQHRSQDERRRMRQARQDDRKAAAEEKRQRRASHRSNSSGEAEREALLLSLCKSKRSRQEHQRLLQERNQSGGSGDGAGESQQAEANTGASSSPTATTETPENSSAEAPTNAETTNAGSAVADDADTVSGLSVPPTPGSVAAGGRKLAVLAKTDGVNDGAAAAPAKGDASTEAAAASSASAEGTVTPEAPAEDGEEVDDDREVDDDEDDDNDVTEESDEAAASQQSLLSPAPTSAASARQAGAPGSDAAARPRWRPVKKAEDGEGCSDAASSATAPHRQSAKDVSGEESTREDETDDKGENAGIGLLRLLRNGSKDSASKDSDGAGDEELLKLLQSKGVKESDGRTDGFCETSAGAFPMSLLEAPWENLVRPIVDTSHAKAFVGQEVFSRRNGGLSIQESGSRPQVLIDMPERGLMIMFKPSGWATCSTPHWEGNEGNLIRHVWKNLNAPTAAPCHRLDKGTSGIVIVATNKNASKHICQQICSKSLVKQYVGLCHGKILPAAGAFSGPLALSQTDKPLGVCYIEGREAVTRFRVLGYFSKPGGKWFSLVQVQIDHGRQHQIRLHMASLGHPLVYDAKYNSGYLREDSEICSRLFLHACYLRCTLPPDEDGGEEPFAVACRLPAELKHSLTSVLTWNTRAGSGDGAGGGRGGEPPLPALQPEAQRLCECLLAQETLSASGDRDAESLHASRLVVRRRDEFLHRFGFNGAEKAEVTRILAMLPTAKERSNALQQFRVLGQRTPDFIVARFAKYVEGLLRWRKQHAEQEAAKEEADNGQSTTNGEEVESEVDGKHARKASMAESLVSEQGSPRSAAVAVNNGASVDPVELVAGPLRIHSDNIWCDVCGCEERTVSLEVPSLSLKIRAPMPSKNLPSCFKEMAKAVHGWEDEEDEREYRPTRCGPCRTYCTYTAVDRRKGDKEKGGCEKGGEKGGEKGEKGGKSQGKGKDKDGGKRSAQALTPEQLEEKEKLRQERELMQIVREFVREQGGSCDGVWVAGKVAARFNTWIRSNAKRNDGSLRKWIGGIPGITVEHCGKNRWRVHSV